MVAGRSRRVRLFAALFSMGLVLGTARLSTAQDSAGAERDLASSDDFRVRVSAALTLGKLKPSGARADLEHALGDPHPAVRAAAAAALSLVGDPLAISALDRRASSETSPSTRAQMKTSADALRRVVQGPWQNARYVVQIGTMKNRTSVRGDQASDVLRQSTLARAQSILGALVSDGRDPALLQQASDRGVPVLVLDGSIQRLSQTQRSRELTFDAQVEFSVRKMPEQMLKGTLSGAATSIGSVDALAHPGRVTILQNQAINGAVESAMRGADVGLAMAAK